MKVETYLRLVRIPYISVDSMPFKAPRGQLPYIVDGDYSVPDSANILEYARAL